MAVIFGGVSFAAFTGLAAAMMDRARRSADANFIVYAFDLTCLLLRIKGQKLVGEKDVAVTPS